MARLASSAPGPERPSRGRRALQRERRRRGWSQAKLIAELRKVAASQGCTLPANGSLVSMISRWENG